jgi:hypothetical protein
VDHHRILVIPVVNPDGYEMALGAQQDWRKNARMVPELRPDGTMQTMFGVDINRNYSFEHITTLTKMQRQALSSRAKRANGIVGANVFDLGGGAFDGDFDPDLLTYAGPGPVSEAETLAVVGLANDLFPDGNRVTGRKCSMSWHTYGGSISNPFGHAPTPPADAAHFFNVGSDISFPTSYKYLLNGFRSEPMGYDTWGDSDDWLYTEHGVLAFTVEAFAEFERGAGDPLFYPADPLRLNMLVDRNVRGALAMAQSNDCNFT